MTAIVQPSFAAGEINPELHGRVDQTLYHIGLARAENMVVQQTGGIYNRAGLRYIGNVKNHAQGARLIPFKFSAEDTYVLEFGQNYIRFIRNDAHVTEGGKSITSISRGSNTVVTAGGHGYTTGDDVYISGVSGMKEINERWFSIARLDANRFRLRSQVNDEDIHSGHYSGYSSGGKAYKIYEISTPYSFNDLDNIKYSQSADVVTFVHSSYTSQKLERRGHTDWALSEFVFGAGVGSLSAVSSYDPIPFSYPSSAINTYNYGFIFVGYDEDEDKEGLPALGNFGFNITNVQAVPGSGLVKITYSATVITLGGSLPFVPDEDYFVGLKNKDIVYIQGVIGTPLLNDKYFAIENVTSTSFTLVGVSESSAGTYTSGGIVNACTLNSPIRIFTETSYNPDRRTYHIAYRFIPSSGLKKYRIYAKDNIGSVTSFRRLVSDPIEITEAFITQGYVDDILLVHVRNINGSYSFGSTSQKKIFYNPDGEEYALANTVFSGEGNRPSVVGFFQQRAIFGSTDNKPEDLYYSGIGAYSEFNIQRIRSSDIFADDQPITTTLSSGEINNIRHLIGLNNLIILTDSTQWQVRPAVGSGLSAKTIEQRPQARVGSSHVAPTVFDDVVIYVREGGQSIIGLGYNADREGYVPTDLSLLSSHMFTGNPVIDIAGVYVPRKRLFCVFLDGSVACLTFIPDQKVIAWTRWYTDGKFESTAVARPNIGPSSDDEAYFVVRRVINGQVVRYVERTDSRQFKDVQDSYFVDAGLTYDNPIEITNIVSGETTTITAEDHGLAVGYEINFSDIRWEKRYDEFFTEISLDQLNNRTYKVKSVPSTSTFTLGNFDDSSNIDSTEFTRYLSGGKVRSMVQTLRGLWYLEGKEVVVLADGKVIDNLIVEGGKIVLPYRYGRIHIGLRYISEIETLPLSLQEPSLQVAPKSMTEVLVRVYQTRGLLLAPIGGEFYELPMRTDEIWGEPTKLLTGNARIPMTGQWGIDGAFILRQKDPLPMGILSALPTFASGDAQ